MKPYIRRILKKLAVKLYHIMARFLTVDKRIVVFNSNIGRSYAGNPKQIYLELLEQDKRRELKLVWFFHDSFLKEAAELPVQANIVRYGHFKYYYFMARAGTWIFDGRQEDDLVKRKNGHYLQTWHGTPLKKLALDMSEFCMEGEGGLKSYQQRFLKNAGTWDALLSQNPFSTETFRRCFRFRGKMLEYGYPRNDCLRKDNTPQKIAALKRKLNLPLDKKLLLYAPTWRDDEPMSGGWYHFTPALDFAGMRDELKDEYFMMVKLHYLVKADGSLNQWSDFIRVCGNHTEISELYLVADALITDYSSVMFDFSVLKRPMYFYAYDLEKYRDLLRGFYFDLLKEAPGPVFLTTKELTEALKKDHTAEFEGRYRSFTDKYNPWDDGCSAKRVVAWMQEQAWFNGGQYGSMGKGNKT